MCGFLEKWKCQAWNNLQYVSTPLFLCDEKYYALTGFEGKQTREGRRRQR
jgi:hypothetical protein